MAKTRDLIGVGSPLVDLLARVPDAFVGEVGGLKGGTEMVDAPSQEAIRERLPAPPERAPGGSAANTVVGAARLGLATGFLCKLGDDRDGAFYRDCMAQAGVDTGAFKVNPEDPTGTCLSLVTPDGQRTMRTYLGAAATLSPADVEVADFEPYRHVHAEGYLLFNQELMVRVLECAKGANCSVSLDVSAPEVIQAAGINALRELLTQSVDMVFANEDEAACFAGTSEEREGLQALSACCALAVVKVGARGAWLSQNGKDVFVPSTPVEAVDTTGAGDLWASGFLTGILSNKPLEEAARMGAKVGARVVQQMGAWIPAEDWEGLV